MVVAAFFLIAFLYASVGHGGASGYLAMMVILGLTQPVMRPMGLLLNLVVSVIATIQFWRHGHFRMKIFLPLAIASVPMAWIGARMHVPDQLFKGLLAGCLVVSIGRILFRLPDVNEKSVHTLPNGLAMVTGAGIGLLSGMIGIGGGILLSPILLIGRWAGLRETAAVSAPFILVNSLVGLLALDLIHVHFPSGWWLCLPAVIIGGFLGSWGGSSLFKTTTMKYLLAMVLIIAVGKLIIS